MSASRLSDTSPCEGFKPNRFHADRCSECYHNRQDHDDWRTAGAAADAIGVAGGGGGAAGDDRIGSGRMKEGRRSLSTLKEG
jgi:hypothetical protein